MSEPSGIVFRREVLPPLADLEREWRALEAVGHPSFFTSWRWIGALLAAVPPASRPQLLRGTAAGKTVALALLGANNTRRRCGLVRSRGFYINEIGDPRFDALTIEHNGILAAASYEPLVWDGLLAWFAGLSEQADELHLSGSLLHVRAEALRKYGLASGKTAAPSFSVDLVRLEGTGGDVSAVLSANSRQQLRRAFRHFERFGPLVLQEAATVQEALAWFGAMKALHCSSWERRGKSHSFANPFFEPFHGLLIERSFGEGGIQFLKVCAGERISPRAARS